MDGIKYTLKYTGVTLTIMPQSRWLVDAIRARHPMPKPPTYTVVNVAGASEEFPLDITALEAPGDTVEAQAETRLNRSKWTAYEAQRRTVIDAIAQDTTDVVLGMAVVEITNPDGSTGVPTGWEGQHKSFGFDVPEDPDRRRVYWLKNVAIRDGGDMTSVISIATTGGPSPAEVETAAEAMKS